MISTTFETISKTFHYTKQSITIIKAYNFIVITSSRGKQNTYFTFALRIIFVHSLTFIWSVSTAFFSLWLFYWIELFAVFPGSKQRSRCKCCLCFFDCKCLYKSCLPGFSCNRIQQQNQLSQPQKLYTLALKKFDSFSARERDRQNERTSEWAKLLCVHFIIVSLVFHLILFIFGCFYSIIIFFSPNDNRSREIWIFV